jgi:enamine deaminase RidA (YjgF/YER057c/UK114 family)
MRIEEKMKELGLSLHESPKLPENFRKVFPFVRVSGNRALISGHAATNPDGSMYPKLGKVGTDLTKEEAYEAARLTGMAIITSLKEELGDLDRVKRWVRVFGMVNVTPGFNDMPWVINGFSDLIIKVWGEEAGPHARSAIGMAELPFDIPVEIEAEVELTN